MKLIYCLNCGDMFNLKFHNKACSCGQCTGRYVDNSYAEITGPCVSVGIGNISFTKALHALGGISADVTRAECIRECFVACWLRPNTGIANPHTKKVEKLSA